jgi:hypothetical protein
MSVQRDFLADRGCVAAELALPERVADHDAGRSAAAAIVVDGELRAQNRGHTDHVEEIAADPHDAGVSRLATGREVQRCRDSNRARITFWRSRIASHIGLVSAEYAL